jgi:hypothetical protein
MIRGYARGVLSIPVEEAYSRLIGEKPLSRDEEVPVGTDAAEESISTTRSNIKSGGGSAAGPGDPEPSGEPGDDDPGGTAASGVNTTRSNIKHATSAAAGGGGVAAESDPIPGVDVKLGKNPGSAAGTGPVRPEPTRPGDPFPPGGGPGGATSSAGEVGDQAEAAGAGEAAASAPPIPGVDIIVRKNPPR